MLLPDLRSKMRFWRFCIELLMHVKLLIRWMRRVPLLSFLQTARIILTVIVYGVSKKLSSKVGKIFQVRADCFDVKRALEPYRKVLWRSATYSPGGNSAKCAYYCLKFIQPDFLDYVFNSFLVPFALYIWYNNTKRQINDTPDISHLLIIINIPL